MKFNDARSFKMAVVPDYVVNPSKYETLPASSFIYDRLRDAGCGVIKMPDPRMVGKGRRGWIISTVDQIQEYTNRGFHVLLLGVEGLPGKGIWLASLNREIGRRNLATPRLQVLTRKQLRSAPEHLYNELQAIMV